MRVKSDTLTHSKLPTTQLMRPTLKKKSHAQMEKKKNSTREWKCCRTEIGNGEQMKGEKLNGQSMDFIAARCQHPRHPVCSHSLSYYSPKFGQVPLQRRDYERPEKMFTLISRTHVVSRLTCTSTICSETSEVRRKVLLGGPRQIRGLRQC